MNLSKNKTFKELGISNEIIQAIKNKGYINPTKIQERVIPLLLNTTSNIIGKAKTGTGKTAAFGIPIIQNITSKNGNIQAIIITPTRELAIQVSEELKTFGCINDLFILCLFGGTPIKDQIKKINNKPDIIVGTPGRILDLINKKKIDLSNISYFVLDEVDEMLNMGFINDIESILSVTSNSKRMLFFSATIPKPIIKIAKKYMKSYEYIEIESKINDLNLTEHFSLEVPKNIKFECLCRFLDTKEDFYGIIFCDRKNTAENINSKLKNNGYNVSIIHGDITQDQRIKTINLFKSKKINILIATDVASRGLDINNLSYVVNYDIPKEYNLYIHRIGRTGRAGNKGKAITFYTKSEYRKLNSFKKYNNINFTKIDIKSLLSKNILLNKQDTFIENISNFMLNKDYFNEESISLFKKILKKMNLDKSNENIEKILICILKYSCSNLLYIKESDSKIDELILKYTKN